MSLARAPRTRFNALLSTMLGTDGAPDPAEQRGSPRREAALTAQVTSGGGTHPALIRNISTGGLTLCFSSLPPLFKGAQLLVHARGFAPFSGSVRWMIENECGLAFNLALADDLLDDSSALFDPGKRARPARARVNLPAIARAPGFERKVTIENISSGGAQIGSGLAIPVPVGRGIMLEVSDVGLIGGYVRWSTQGRCGLMFSKMLPVAAAEEIAQRCAIHPSWLREVKAAHAALTGSAG